MKRQWYIAVSIALVVTVFLNSMAAPAHAASNPTLIHGIKGTYYRYEPSSPNQIPSIDSMTPIFDRVDARPSFNFGYRSPGHGISSTFYAARFEGLITPSLTGPHWFYATVDDGIRVYIDDVLVIDSWQRGIRRSVSGFVNMAKYSNGDFHKIRVEYAQYTGEVFGLLYWNASDAPLPFASWVPVDSRFLWVAKSALAAPALQKPTLQKPTSPQMPQPSPVTRPKPSSLPAPVPARADLKTIFGVTCSPEAGGVQACRNITYATDSSGKAVKLDVYLPSNFSAQSPVSLYFHNGGWFSGSRAQCDPTYRHGYTSQLQDFVTRDKAVLICASYHLTHWSDAQQKTNCAYQRSDECGLNGDAIDMIKDVHAAVRFARKTISNLTGLPIDQQKIGAMGDSAGGTLAALAGLTSDINPMLLEYPNQDLTVPSSVQSVFDFCGALDLNTMFALGGAGRDTVWAYMGFGKDWGNLKLADPLAVMPMTKAEIPPFFIVHGAKDTMIPTGLTGNFVKGFTGASLTVQQPNVGHDDWRAISGLLPTVGSFLRSHLAPGPVPGFYDTVQQRSARAMLAEKRARLSLQ